jgi:molybdopterin converting factor small subunit
MPYALCVVTIIIPQTLRELSNGDSRVEVEGGSSLRQVINRLEAKHPGFKERLIEDDDIRAGIAFFVNDNQITEGIIERVPEEATVLIIPALGGGSSTY